ncbi:MAG: hypothetical protein MUO23_03385, partial [Anaerolineales bacterium]|nr:hypothetical protein [Anaerolineales bacterium]
MKREVPDGEVHFRGLLRLQRQLQDRLRHLAHPEPGAPGKADSVHALHSEILEQLADIAVVLERAGLGPETLPDPSRRAYQWLSYLGEEQALQEHVLTLRQAMRV